MQIELTQKSIGIIKTSLEYSRQQFENYEYPTHDLKQQRIGDINDVLAEIISEVRRNNKEIANNAEA